MKKILILLTSLFLIVITSLSVYQLVNTNHNVKEAKETYNVLLEEQGHLQINNNKKTKEVNSLAIKIDELEADIEDFKKVNPTLSSKRIESQSVYDTKNTETPKNDVPITEYKVPSEDDYKKATERVQKETKIESNEDTQESYDSFPSEPVYDVYQGPIFEFLSKHGISVETLAEMNGHAGDSTYRPSDGETVRIR